MTLKREFAMAIGANQGGILVLTDEPSDALQVMSTVCDKYRWELRVWDRIYGSRMWERGHKTAEETSSRTKKASEEKAPSAATHQLAQDLAAFLKEPPKRSDGGSAESDPIILAVRNFQVCPERPDDLITLLQHINNCRMDHKHVVLLAAPGYQLHPLLAPMFYTIQHELPDLKELIEVLDSVRGDMNGKPSDADRTAAAKAALGLNRLQAESAFAMCVLRHQKYHAGFVWDQKVKQLNESGLLEIYRGEERFDQVGGLDGAKRFLTALLRPDPFDAEDADVRAKGVTLLGPPGVGKSLIAKCLGNETARPVVLVNVGKLLGSYVGETEKATRQLFGILKRLAPVIAVVDEFGKQMPSTSARGTDSGVSARLAGEFLTQMNDIKEDIFWVFTDNNIEHVDRGFTRAERIDAIIYAGLPRQAQRATCWRIYFKKFFPEKIGDKPYPHYIELDVDKLLEAYKKDAEPDDEAWGHKFAPAFMCLPTEERDKAFAKIQKAVDNSLCAAIREALIDDGSPSVWTPAEIRACVRLMRRTKRTLADTAKVIGHVADGDSARIDAVEDWCALNGALDAETGELLLRDEKIVEDAGHQEKVKRSRQLGNINIDVDSN